MNYEVILKIVQDFYHVAIRDILIGYHFRVIDDFEEHIPQIASFWELQLLGEITHREHLPFDLINKHKVLKINLGEVDRWVRLFEEVLNRYHNEKKISSEDKDLWINKIDFFQKKIKALAL